MPTPRETARRYYAEGQRQYNAGRYSAAVRAFEAAYAAQAHPVVLKSIGECQERLGNLAAAVDMYERYLRDRSDAPDRAEYQARIATLRERIRARATPARTQPPATPPPAAPVTPPATVSPEPVATPPPTAPTTPGKVAPTAEEIAAASWRYGAEPQAPAQPAPAQYRPPTPTGALAWLNPPDRPVYMRPWFLLAGAAVGALAVVVAVKGTRTPPALPAKPSTPALPPHEEE